MKLYPNITYIFTIWLISILLISFVGFSTLPHSRIFSDDFLKSFSNWDGGHFLGIAKEGYKERFQFAFFPLYPLTIKAVNQIIQNYFISAILISIVATFLGMHLLYKLVSITFEKKIAEKTILGLLFFPTSFYFITSYSEGLFFLLVVATFYFLRSRKFLLATIFAILASATRLSGLAVVLGVLVEVITIYGINRKNWYILLAPLGFLIYCFYLLKLTGDPFYFTVAELHWQRNITIPSISFWETIKNLSQGGFISNHFNTFLDLVFAIFGLGLAVRTFRFLPPSFAIYSLASVLLPLFTPTLSSMPRFLLPIFPIFILLAFFKNRFLILGYQLISLMLLSIFTVLFLNGYWVS